MTKRNKSEIYGLILLIFHGLRDVSVAQSYPLKITTRAYTTSGFKGCYSGRDADINNLNVVYDTYTGEQCKRLCESKGFRYAGTGQFKNSEVEGNYCTCFDDLKRFDESEECDSTCIWKYTEMCGGRLRLSVYDTWLCATIPCENNGICEDISSNSYECTCRAGWSGTNCTDPDTKTTTLHTQETGTSGESSTMKIAEKTSKHHERTMTTTTTRTKSTASMKMVSKQTEDPTTETNESSFTAVYIAVPVVIIILVIVTVTVLLICRRRHRKNTPHSASYRNEAYTGQINREKSSPQYSNEYLGVTQDQYSEIQQDTVNPEEIIVGNNEYNTTDLKQTGFQKANNDYSHLKRQSDEFIDTTYSHVTEKDRENINSGSTISAYDHGFTSQKRYNEIVSKSDGKSVYDYTCSAAGGHDPKIKQADEYSHLHDVFGNNSEQNSTNEPPVLQHHTCPNTKLNISNDCEKAIGDTPQYFVLEPFQNNSPEMKKENFALRDTNDFDDGNNEVNYSHEYFILQKETI